MRYVEKKKLPFANAPEDDRSLPDVHLGLYDDVIVFDHVEKVVLLFLILIKDTSLSKALLEIVSFDCDIC